MEISLSPVTPDAFIDQYNAAMATRHWPNIDPLIDPDACVTFSTGAVHIGKPAIRDAFERNFTAIQNDTYAMSNLHWVHQSPSHAGAIFAFAWTGLIGGQPASGAGRGTLVLIHADDRWQLLAEHLGAAPN